MLKNSTRPSHLDVRWVRIIPLCWVICAYPRGGRTRCYTPKIQKVVWSSTVIKLRSEMWILTLSTAQISDHRREVTDAIVCKMGKVRESITDLSRSWSWNGLNRVHHTKWECPDKVFRGEERFLTSQNFIRRSSPQETMTDGLFGLYSTSLWVI